MSLYHVITSLQMQYNDYQLSTILDTKSFYDRYQHQKF